MRKIALFVCLLTMLAGCASGQYQAAQDDLVHRKQQCVATYGGTNVTQLRTVPKENILAATECYNQAEAATLIPVYNRWGYSAASTYQKQAALLELARRRASGSISADDFAALAMQLEAAVMADLHNQDATLKQQRAANAAANAQAWQALNNAVNPPQPEVVVVQPPAMQTPTNTNCSVSANGRFVNCRTW